MTTDIEAAATRAKEATTPATFNFAATILDRSYPEVDVPIYIDERAVQSLLDIYKERAELEQRIAKVGNPSVEWANKLNELTELYDLTREDLKDHEYTVKILGISPEASAALEEKSFEDFPREYTESVSPVTGAVIKTEIESDKREKHFANLIRQAHIVSITSPDGSVDSDWTDIDKVTTVFARLPLLARAKVDEAINSTTITVDFYRELVDEVF